MFHHILVPLDGSPLAEQAVPVAARIARLTGGSLLLVQVVISPPDYGFPVPSMSQEGIDEQMDSASAYLQALSASYQLAGIKIRTEVLFGLPAQNLLAFTDTAGINLIVLCSHGRTGFTRWVLGSVAHVLVHQCKLPVLVLRQDETPSLAPIGSGGSFRTLVPLDGSSRAEVALRPAAYVTAALAEAGQGVLHLSQVVKILPLTAEEGIVSELDEEALRDARTSLSQAERHVFPEGKDLQLSLIYSVELASDVASTLLTLAEHGKTSEDTKGIPPCDLIAISTHGRGGLERWVMGSVTERLLNTTKLPMLIVRPPEGLM